MNYIALKKSTFCSNLVLISSSFRNRSKNKISTLILNLKLFLSLKGGFIWLVNIGLVIRTLTFYVMSFWLCLFSFSFLFPFSCFFFLLLLVCALFTYMYNHFFKQDNGSAHLVRFLTTNYRNENCKSGTMGFGVLCVNVQLREA